jgi:hypothetical protein
MKRLERGGHMRIPTLLVIVFAPGVIVLTGPSMNVPDAVPKASGGRVFHLLASTGVPTALAEIASDINHQYRVDYTRPAAAAAAPDLVDVSVQQSGLTVRATRFAPR